MKIWSAWLQGRKNAPEHVQKIFYLWEDLNPECDLHVVEQQEADDIISKLGCQQKVMTSQVKTNFVRTYLLAEYGGVWVDSTLLPIKPLRDWLKDDLTAQGFFAFHSSGAPELVLQNWFLFSEKNNPITVGWLECYKDYFMFPRYFPSLTRATYQLKFFDFLKYKVAMKNRDYMYFMDPDRGRSCSIYPYAAHNYNLKYLLDNNSDLSKMWGSVPKLYNTLPSMIGRWASDRETPDKVFIELALEALKISPVHKLNHRDVRFNELIDQGLKLGCISK
ncbi:capsular polysaccharide synthesis protein [Nitrincola sp.]|uniref:capsular polysaccharide synthesis protein n=1 Tax=Nitrincola sp. TaxID=1926584 RepID=UPI003A903DB7